MGAPVTAAMSVCGVENVIYWIMDSPEVMDRFRDLFADMIIEHSTPCARPPARRCADSAFSDDNCAMLNPAMYERFGLPIRARLCRVLP